VIPDEVLRAVQGHPYPLLFATVSGAHLYGFPSVDSDWDLRGAHVLPAESVLGLLPVEDTVELSSKEGVELDIVSHDVRKFFGLLLKANGYVLEQLYSPIIVLTSPEHEELKGIARGCITRFHVHHYLGFAANQWELFLKEEPHRVKPLLYVFRVLLTGIHLMETGEVEANLCVLNDCFRIPFIPDLIARKTGGVEQQVLSSDEMEHFDQQFTQWKKRLMEAGERSKLPSENSAKAALNDLLVRLRLRSIQLADMQST
jgi:predicted nucleotidyltransferase